MFERQDIRGASENARARNVHVPPRETELPRKETDSIRGYRPCGDSPRLRMPLGAAASEEVRDGNLKLSTARRRPPARIDKRRSRLAFAASILSGDVKSEQLSELEQHQFRRPSRPMSTPINTAPAMAPRGLRRAMLSNSVAMVFTCSLAADVISAPLPA